LPDFIFVSALARVGTEMRGTRYIIRLQGDALLVEGST